MRQRSTRPFGKRSRLRFLSLATIAAWAALVLMAAGPRPVRAADDAEAVPGAASDTAALRQLEIERDILRRSLLEANDEIDKQIRGFERTGAGSADLENKLAQLDELRAFGKRVGNQVTRWNLELEGEQRIKVIEMATRPQSSNAVAREWWSGVFGLIGFAVGIVVVGGGMMLRSRSSRIRWKVPLVSALLLGGLSLAMVLALMPFTYEAQALIKVAKTVPILMDGVPRGPEDEAAAYDILKKTQVQFLKSNFVLNRAVRKQELKGLATMQEHADDPVGFLQSHLVIDYPGGAELLRVALKGTNRDDLPIIVNAVVQSYMDEIVAGDKMGRLAQRDNLVAQHSKILETFRQKYEEYNRLSEQLGSNASEATRLRKKIAEQRVEALAAGANELEARIRDVELRIELLKQRTAKPEDSAKPGAAAKPDQDAKAGDDAAAAPPPADERQPQ